MTTPKVLFVIESTEIQSSGDFYSSRDDTVAIIQASMPQVLRSDLSITSSHVPIIH
jgi:hypothetical protein